MIRIFSVSSATLFLAASLISGVGAARAQTPAPDASPIASPKATGTADHPTESTEMILVPKGTQILVRTEGSYNSYAAHTGEQLQFEVVQDAIVNGHVVARAGDGAEGVIQEGQSGESGFYGIGYKAANLRLAVQQVHNFCGDTLHVNFDRSEYRRKQGMFGSNKDVTVAKGQMYVPIVSYAQKVCSVVTSATPAPLPDDAIRTSDH